MTKEKITLPKKPRKATHIYFETTIGGKTKHAMVTIKDVDTLVGVTGAIWYVFAKKGRILEKYLPQYKWDGKGVEQLERKYKKGKKGTSRSKTLKA